MQNKINNHSFFMFFLYSYISGKAKLSLIPFYIFLVGAAFHIWIFCSGQNPYGSNKIRLIHGLCVFIFLYVACVNINFIKKDILVRKLRKGQLDGLEMWINWEVGDMLEIDPVCDCTDLVHLVVDHPLHRQNRGEAARLNKIRLFR